MHATVLAYQYIWYCLLCLYSIETKTTHNLQRHINSKFSKMHNVNDMKSRREAILSNETSLDRIERLRNLIQQRLLTDEGGTVKTITKLAGLLPHSLDELEASGTNILIRKLTRTPGMIGVAAMKYDGLCNEATARLTRKRPREGEMTYHQTFTITMGDQAENNVGMQKIGELAEKGEGFSYDDLKRAEDWFATKQCKTEMISLTSHLPEELRNSCELDAYVLVIRGGLNAILGSHNADDDFFMEQARLPKDRRAFMYGRVVEKHARHNLCFSEVGQEPDYEAAKGRVVAFGDVPLLRRVRDTLPDIIGEKARTLAAEGNYYFDLKNCGIGFHGDSERRKVVGIRVGAAFPLHFV